MADDVDTAATEAGAAAMTDEGAPVPDDGSAEPSGEAPAADEAAEDPLALLEHEGEIAADYLEGLLDILDLDGDLDLDVEGDRASVAIVGSGLGTLIGPRGSTLEALQELTRLAVLTKTGARSRLMLDIGGHRARRRAELTRTAEEAARRVLETGTRETLPPMTPFERKVVHDAIAAIDGVRSESEGEEPGRFVVVHPSD